MNVVMTLDPGSTIRHLNVVADAIATDLVEFLIGVGELISEQIDYNFRSNDWPALAPATLARKQAQGYPLDILVREGYMKDDAISGEWSSSGSAAGIGAVASLEVPGYSAFHFESTEFMPERDYAFLPDSIGPQVQQLFSWWLDARLY